jgi:hypothetical protein
MLLLKSYVCKFAKQDDWKAIFVLVVKNTWNKEFSAVYKPERFERIGLTKKMERISGGDWTVDQRQRSQLVEERLKKTLVPVEERGRNVLQGQASDVLGSENGRKFAKKLNQKKLMWFQIFVQLDIGYYFV